MHRSTEKCKKRFASKCGYRVALALCLLLLNHVSAFSDNTEIFSIIDVWFSQNPSKPPAGWEIVEKQKPVLIDIANEVVNLKSRNSSFGLRKNVRFSVKEFPSLTWKWKAITLPANGDFRASATDDQAAQIYVAFPRFPEFVNTRIVGYLWDNEAPRGSAGTSPAWYNLKCIVIRDKTDALGEWVVEKRDVYADYKMLFDEEPPEVGAVSVYINSQHTKSRAECCFGFIRFEKVSSKN